MHLTLPLAAQCCAACAAIRGCHAWTWHPPKASDPMSNFCWLMSRAGSPHNSGLITGVERGYGPPPVVPVPPLPPASPLAPPLGFQPNIVYILTDDQDTTQDSMDAMPETKKLFGLSGGGCAGGGACFNLSRAYVATPICCPSRSSYLR